MTLLFLHATKLNRRLIMSKRERSRSPSPSSSDKPMLKRRKARSKQDSSSDCETETLQQLFDTVNENDIAKVKELLESVSKETLSGKLMFPGIKKELSSKLYTFESLGVKWVKESWMPWNPSPNINPQTYRCTCLHLASVLGLPEICHLILKKGADPNTRDSASNSVIILAAASGDADTVRTVISGGVLSQSCINNEGVSALHVACKQGNADVVKVLLEQPEVDVNKASSYIDEIPLFCAAYFGHLQVAALLVEKGACVNKITDYGFTAVLEAARNSHCAMIDFLAKKGANLNVLSRYSNLCSKSSSRNLRFPFHSFTHHTISAGSPLNFAVHNSQDGSSVQVLLDHGADVEAYTDQSCSTLALAASECKIDIMRMLLRAGADVNRNDIAGAMLSPLLTVIRSYHPGGWKSMEAKILECIKFLVEEAGASLEVTDESTGENCMHLCVQAELLDVFAYLLEKGADPWEYDYYNKSAIKICLQGDYGCRRHWVLKCLQAGLFNWDNMTFFRWGLKPLDYAVSYSDIHLIKMFEAAGFLHKSCLTDDGGKVFPEEAKKYFESALKRVPSLQNISRYVILYAIGERPGRRAGIESLPIVKKLKQFLMYEDLLPLLEPFHSPDVEPIEDIDPGSEQFHSITDHELIKERGAPSEVLQLTDSETENEVMESETDDGEMSSEASETS